MEGQAPDYSVALAKARDGKVSEELKALYRAPVREQVPWLLFPDWARPTDPVEGGHEG